MEALLLLLLSLMTLVFAAPTAIVKSEPSLAEVTDQDIFEISLDEFIIRREALDGPSELDWTSDGCTAAPNDPLGFDFLECCQRHDFAYRNYKEQGRFNSETKFKIDENFRNDMYNICEDEFLTEACDAIALLYYEAVEFLGSKRDAEILRAREALEKALEGAVAEEER